MQDFLKIDSLLTQDEKMVRDMVRRFVDAEVLPIIADAYESAQFPNAWIKRLAELKIFGMTLPEEYGGTNANAVTYGLVCQELERGDSGLRSFISVQNALCMYPIYQFGTSEQKEKYLMRMAHGEVIGCFGLTEPNAGSDPASMQTTAKEVSGGYELSGTKTWITNATVADIAIVWARTKEGIRGFIVEKGREGFSSSEIKKKLSMRASVTGQLHFQECFVPKGNLLPKSEIGLVAALKCLTEARFGIGWGAIGSAMACYDIAVDYTKERTQFEKPLASKQLVQKELAIMLEQITKCQLLNLHVGRLKEKGLATHQMVSLIKMAGAKDALDCARRARNLLGGNGITLDYHVIRHMANLETVFTYEGTDNIHSLVLGKQATNIDAF